MKQLFTFIAAAFIALSAPAAERFLSKAVTANTATNLFTSGRYVIKEIYFLNTDTTNSARIKLYDSATTSTNIVVSATTIYSTTTTNYSVVHTNTSGIVITNTFSGLATIGTAVSASTNERPKILEFVVPVNDDRLIPRLRIAPLNGTLLLSDRNGIVEVTYDQID